MYENEYGTPMGPAEREYEYELEQRRQESQRKCEPERLHLQEFGLHAELYQLEEEEGRAIWRVANTPANLELIKRAGFEVRNLDHYDGLLRVRRSGPLLITLSPVEMARIRAAANAAEEEVKQLRTRIESAFIGIGGSTIWDGGRLALRDSDVDVFVGLSTEDTMRIKNCAPGTEALLREIQFKYPMRTEVVPAPHGLWALTGREAAQIHLVRGERPRLTPAPNNAESSMIRRAAMRMMGVDLCAPGPDVGPEHMLRGPEAIQNSLSWVTARAVAWSDEKLIDMTGRIRTALAGGKDLREVL